MRFPRVLVGWRRRLDKAFQLISAQRHLPLFVLLVILPAVATILALSGIIENIIRLGLGIDGAAPGASKLTIIISPWITGAFLGLLIILIVSATYHITSARGSRKVLGFANRAHARVQRARQELRSHQSSYRDTVHATHRMCNQIFGTPNITRHNYVKIAANYRIDRNGNARVQKTLTVKAGPEPVYFLKLYVDGRPNAVPVATYEMIKFRVRVNSGDPAISFLPISDEAQRKEFALFFLPFIPPDEERTFTISYDWPRFFSGLQRNGIDEFFWDNKGHDVGMSTSFDASFEFDESYGALTYEVIGPRSGRMTISKKQQQGSTHIRLQDDAMPISDTTYRIIFRRPHVAA
jgi:hypothetical protein